MQGEVEAPDRFHELYSKLDDEDKDKAIAFCRRNYEIGVCDTPSCLARLSMEMRVSGGMRSAMMSARISSKTSSTKPCARLILRVRLPVAGAGMGAMVAMQGSRG